MINVAHTSGWGGIESVLVFLHVSGGMDKEKLRAPKTKMAT